MANVAMGFKKATREQVRLRIGIQGPAGSGKTRGALELARGIVGPTGRIALIDTENRSAAYYADHYEFDALDLAPPFTTRRYIEAMRMAVSAGYDILIIDTISHQWMGEGGILERKEALDKAGRGNSYTNWAQFTPETNQFRETLLHFPIHLIVTMRAKQEYVLVQNDKGKQEPKKLGMAPQVRDGMDYELGLVFDVQMDHRARVTKSRIDLFDDADSTMLYNLLEPEVGVSLGGWARKGVAAPPPAPRLVEDEHRPDPTSDGSAASGAGSSITGGTKRNSDRSAATVPVGNGANSGSSTETRATGEPITRDTVLTFAKEDSPLSGTTLKTLTNAQVHWLAERLERRAPEVWHEPIRQELARRVVQGTGDQEVLIGFFGQREADRLLALVADEAIEEAADVSEVFEGDQP